MVDTLARQRMIIGTTVEWNANDLVLGAGEIALERMTTGEVKAKVGDGVKRFSQSPYLTIDQEQAIALFDDSLRLDTRALLYGPATTQVIGRAGAVTAGAGVGGNATYGIISPALVDSNITGVRAWLGTGGTGFKVKIFEQIAGVWTQVGANVSMVGGGSGGNSWSVAGATMAAIPIKAGQIVGFYGGGADVSYDDAATPKEPYASAAGDQSTLGGTVNQVQFKVGFDLLPTGGSVGIQTIGRKLDANFPTTATGILDNNTWAFATPATAPSYITAFQAYASAPFWLEIKVFRQIAGVWTELGSRPAFTYSGGKISVAAGTLAPIFVPEGAIVGFCSQSGGVVAYDLAAPLDLMMINPTAGSQHTVTVYDGSKRVDAGYELTPVSGVALQREPIDDAIDATALLKAPAIQTIGQAAVTTGSPAGNGTYFIGPAAFDGAIASARMAFGAAGNVQVQAFRRDSAGLMVPVGNAATIALAAGINSFAVNLPIAVGDYVGWYTPALMQYTTAGVAGKNPYYFQFGNFIGSAYPVTVLPLENSTNLLQAGFDVSYAAFRGLKYQVIGQAAYNALGVYDPNTLYVIQGALTRDDDRPGIEELPALPHTEPPPIGETLPELPEAGQ